MNRVLVISPHPDDESIGCGGTLRRHVEAGDQVHVVFLTSGERGGHGPPIEEVRRIREAEAKQAGSILGIQHMEFWAEPDGALESHPQVVGRLQSKLSELEPTHIYGPHPDEMHRDHQAAARIVQEALERGRGKTEVLMYEVWTPIQGIDEVVDITPYIQTKLAAVRAYKSQCAVVAFDESVLGLNRYRGEMFSWPEGEYAEIFSRLSL